MVEHLKQVNSASRISELINMVIKDILIFYNSKIEYFLLNVLFKTSEQREIKIVIPAKYNKNEFIITDISPDDFVELEDDTAIFEPVKNMRKWLFEPIL